MADGVGKAPKGGLTERHSAEGWRSRTRLRPLLCAWGASSSLKARAPQQAPLLKHRIGHGGQQRIDLLAVAQRIEMDRTGFDRLTRTVAQAQEVALAGLARSEERRVGKEGRRGRWAAYAESN